MADQKEDKIEPIPQPESTLSKIMKVSKIVALALAGLAAVVLGLEASGIVLPPQVKAIALTITALAGALGITKSALDRNGDGKVDEKDEELK